MEEAASCGSLAAGGCKVYGSYNYYDGYNPYDPEEYAQHVNPRPVGIPSAALPFAMPELVYQAAAAFALTAVAGVVFMYPELPMRLAERVAARVTQMVHTALTIMPSLRSSAASTAALRCQQEEEEEAVPVANATHSFFDDSIFYDDLAEEEQGQDADKENSKASLQARIMPQTLEVPKPSQSTKAAKRKQLQPQQQQQQQPTPLQPIAAEQQPKIEAPKIEAPKIKVAPAPVAAPAAPAAPAAKPQDAMAQALREKQQQEADKAKREKEARRQKARINLH
jgi:hypothetical protein